MEPEPNVSPELLAAALDVPLTRPPATGRPLPVRMLTPEQVADALQVTRDAVRRWLRSGRLKGIFIGRIWRIHPDDLEAFIDANRPKPGADL
jgi:excisionase family DNA binding protein